MAFAEGNQFWKLRMKHGRDAVIQSPQMLLDNFDEYCQWIQENPLIEKDWVGKDANMVERERMRPITKQGFAASCGLSEWKRISELKKKSDDFHQVVTHIESIIAAYNITGASAGMLNPNIIARIESLAENTNSNHSISNLPDWMKDE
jgi:hypothetical protein